jgi:hypothetical protein
MRFQVTDNLDFETTSCAACGVVFAMPAALLAKHRERGDEFFCPNGHNLQFKETTIDRLNKALEAAKERAGRAEAETAAERELREAAEKKLERRRRRRAGGAS